MDALFILFHLLAAVLCISVANRFYHAKIKGRFASNEIPLSFNLLRASGFLAWGIVLSKIPSPFLEASAVLKMTNSGMDLLMMQGVYFSVFLSICIALYVIMHWLSAILYSVFLNGNSYLDDAIHDRTSGTILYAGLHLGMVLSVAQVLPFLFGLFVEHPTTPMFN